MAATNPFKVTDLVHKYGWDVMVRLSALGIQNLADAQVLFVDSGATNASDADDGYHGHTMETPLATLDYAVGLCTASEQAIIIAAPGHAETLAEAGTLVTCDITGTKIIGIGEGTLRPTLTLSTDTDAIAFSVTAANVALSNIRVVAAVDAVAKCISVSNSDCKLIDIEVVDTSAAVEAAIGILTTSAADRLYIENYKHNGFLAGNACTQAISLVGVDRAEIVNSWFRGAFSTAAIQMVTTACSGVVIKDCVFENGTTALSLDIVDNASSKWSAINCFDVVGGYAFSGGSGEALVADTDKNQSVRKMASAYYVNANVAASGTGTSWDTAFQTITEAVAAATTQNDIIYVAPGDYDEGATLAITTQGLQIIGPGPDTQNKAMIYDGQSAGYDLMTINAHEVIIDGIAFSAAEDTYDGIVVGGSSASYKVTIRNCRLDGWSGEYGIQAGAVNDCPDILIENNLFRSWNTAAVQLNCTRACVRNNIFWVATDCIGLEHVSTGGNRPDNVYVDNYFCGASNSSTTGIKFTGTPTAGMCICSKNMLAGTWDTSITESTATACVNNYVADASGGALIDGNS